MISLEEYARLEREARALAREKDKLEGALAQIQDQLLREFGCSDEGGLKALLKKVKKEEDRLEAKFQKDLIAFEARWGESLGGP